MLKVIEDYGISVRKARQNFVFLPRLLNRFLSSDTLLQTCTALARLLLQGARDPLDLKAIIYCFVAQLGSLLLHHYLVATPAFRARLLCYAHMYVFLAHEALSFVC